MPVLTYQAIIVVGDIAAIYHLHQGVRQLLWNQSPDFVRLLSPVCYGLAGRLASFAILPHGHVLKSAEAMQVDTLSVEVIKIISNSPCVWVQVEFSSTEAKFLAFGCTSPTA